MYKNKWFDKRVYNELNYITFWRNDYGKEHKTIIIVCLLILIFLTGIFTTLYLSEDKKTAEEVRKNIEQAKEKTKSNRFKTEKISSPNNMDCYVEIILHKEFDVDGNLFIDIHLNNGNKEKLLASKNLRDLWMDDIVVWLDDSKLLIDHRKIYDIKSESFYELEIPIKIWDACLSPDKNKVGYIGKDLNDKISIGFYDLLNHANKIIYTIEPDDWGNNLEPIVYVDWGTKEELYFDAPIDGIPNIFKYSLLDNKISNIAKNARIPQASDDGEFIAYLKSDRYNGNGSMEKQTVIKDLVVNKSIKYPWYKKVKYDKNNIYIIGQKDLKILTKGLKKIKNISVKGVVMFPVIKKNQLIFSEILIEEGKVNSVRNHKYLIK